MTSYFSDLKVTAARNLLPLRPAKSESNGGRYFRNFTVYDSNKNKKLYELKPAL